MHWIHEVHRIRGALEDDFEAAYRDLWMPAVAQSGDAKLCYFAHLTDGSGRAYTRLPHAPASFAAVTVTTSPARSSRRPRGRWWCPPISPMFPVGTAHDHESTLFMEDTVWPDDGKLLDYLEGTDKQYVPSLVDSGNAGTAIIELQTLPRTVRWSPLY